jgi:uncharacterized damage-inducible protein DinB
MTWTEAWLRNNEADLFLLNCMTPRLLVCRYSERTRTVAAQFAHMHNVRIHHLERRAKDLAGKLKPFERGAQPVKRELVAALKASATAMGGFLERIEAGEKVKSWNRSGATYLGYLIAHEAHHRGLVMVSLRLSGEKLPKDMGYGIWNWGKKGSL